MVDAQILRKKERKFGIDLTAHSLHITATQNTDTGADVLQYHLDLLENSDELLRMRLQLPQKTKKKRLTVVRTLVSMQVQRVWNVLPTLLFLLQVLLQAFCHQVTLCSRVPLTLCHVLRQHID